MSDNKEFTKEDYKRAATKEISSMEDESTFEEAIKFAAKNSEAVAEVHNEILNEQEAAKEKTPVGDSPIVYEIEEIKDDENDGKKEIISEVKKSETDTTQQTKKDETKKDGEDSKTKTEGQDEQIDETKLLADLAKTNPEFAKFKNLDELSQGIKQDGEAEVKKAILAEAKGEVDKVIGSLIEGDKEIKELLAAAGLDEMPNGSREEWLEFAAKHGNIATKIENRVSKLADAELSTRANVKYYEKIIPSKNEETVSVFADEISDFAKSLMPEGIAEDFKPVGEALVKFLNGGKIDAKYFDVKQIGEKKFAVLNKERMVTDFKYANQETFDKLRGLAVEKKATQSAQKNISRLKDKTSTDDLASKNGTKGDNKIINPKNPRDYEGQSEETIQKMLDDYRNKTIKQRNY